MTSYCRMNAQAARQAGFSLFEVLIAIVITSIGLLGLAGMQAAGLQNNHSAYQRSQATMLAYDIADRMRANTVSIDNYLTSFMTLEQATAAGEQAGCKTTSGCSTIEMAQNDLRDWNTALTAALPGATGTITVTGNIYTVSVNWDDDRDGDVDTDDPDFKVSFQP
jgi:type IV pilus assembly protein PilV